MNAGRILRSPAPWLVAAVLATAFAAWLPVAPSLASLFTLEGFGQLGDARVLRVLGRTAWIAGAAALLSMLLGAPLALLAHRVRLPGAAALALLLPLPLFLPPLLLAAGWHGLTGMDGPWAAVFTLGACYAPFPALLAGRALARQAPAAHESALLSGGPRLAIAEMTRGALPGAVLGGALAFMFAATDFAVPDYFASVGAGFDVYANLVFNAWRDATQTEPGAAARAALHAGTAAAAPLLLMVGLVFWGALTLGDRLGEAEPGGDRPPPRLAAGRWAAPLLLVAAAGAAVLLLAPLGRIVFETGNAGPLAEGSWLGRSREAFAQAVARGRGDLGRSLGTGVLAALFAGAVAPFLAHALVRGGRGWRFRFLALLLALPLLAPAVGVGIGAILVFNREGLVWFYESRLLPALVLGGRFLPVAVFLLAERLQRVPAVQEEAAALAGAAYPLRVLRYRLGPQRGAWWLAAGIVAVFAVRELDLAILLPAANASAAVRYYNALHFARDNFVAAFGLLIALVLFLPLALHALARSFGRGGTQ